MRTRIEPYAVWETINPRETTTNFLDLCKKEISMREFKTAAEQEERSSLTGDVRRL
ncbi:19757_t:CDS:2 [Funneliformis geosporum]|uniref:19757_t:CDS:1 n=1 Tax=Funneliformis geosporum TaxID=1117311 RepID=A0A9W4SDW8_9GLOM|nr:19757_t:CDS:2 [Funneliformis geosporum]